MKFKNQNGQLMIVILLVMVVTLTIGLTVASRQLTNIRLTNQTELSQKAFSAAEAGIEDALRRDLNQLSFDPITGVAPLPQNSVSGADYNVEVKKSGVGGSTEFVSEKVIPVNDITQVLTEGLPPINSSITVCWAQSDPRASIEIIEIYDSGGWQIQRTTLNPSDYTGSPNGFTLNPVGPACTIGTAIFNEASPTINLHQGTKLVRIRPIYHPSIIGVRASHTLPEQSYIITSVGSVGGVSRKIEVSRSYNVTPAILDFGLYSGSQNFPLAK